MAPGGKSQVLLDACLRERSAVNRGHGSRSLLHCISENSIERWRKAETVNILTANASKTQGINVTTVHCIGKVQTKSLIGQTHVL